MIKSQTSSETIISKIRGSSRRSSLDIFLPQCRDSSSITYFTSDRPEPSSQIFKVQLPLLRLPLPPSSQKFLKCVLVECPQQNIFSKKVIDFVVNFILTIYDSEYVFPNIKYVPPKMNSVN